LGPEKITATVTDNGANFVKSFREYNTDVVYGTDDSDSSSPSNDDVEFLTLETDVADNMEHDNDHMICLPTHVRCASHTLSLVCTMDAGAALKTSASFSRLNHSAMGKCSALWNAASRPKSAEIIQEICQCQLRTPCVTCWNSLHDSITKLLDKRLLLPKLMSALSLPLLKDVEIEFLEEYRRILHPVAVALDRLQGSKSCYYADLLPTLFKINTQLASLQSVNFKHCTPLLNAVSAGFHRRFDEFLQLSPSDSVNSAILATMTHPYFKYVGFRHIWHISKPD